MNSIRLTLLLTIFSLEVFAQDFEVPKNYKLESTTDYDILEKDVVNCVNWLMETPVNEQVNKRKESYGFLLVWISGSSKVHIELNTEIVTFMDDGELLMIFMGAWTKYSLESKDFNNKINGSMAGIESVIDFYMKNKTLIPKNKEVDKYIKMKEKGSLKGYVEENA